jgi:hypothetical protein
MKNNKFATDQQVRDYYLAQSNVSKIVIKADGQVVITRNRRQVWIGDIEFIRQKVYYELN